MTNTFAFLTRIEDESGERVSQHDIFPLTTQRMEHDNNELYRYIHE